MKLLAKHPEKIVPNIVLNTAIDEDKRTSAIEALLILFYQKVITRSELFSYYQQIADTLPQTVDSGIWSHLINAVSELRPVEMEACLRQAMNAGCHLIFKDDKYIDQMLAFVPTEEELAEVPGFLNLDDVLAYWEGGAMPQFVPLHYVPQVKEQNPKLYRDYMGQALSVVLSGILSSDFPDCEYYSLSEEQIKKYVQLTKVHKDHYSRYKELMTKCEMTMSPRLNLECERVVEYMLEGLLR